MSATKVDIEQFAERVERLCDFLLHDLTKDGSEDVKVLQELKEDAANLQSGVAVNVFIDGLHDHIHGVPRRSET